MKKKQIVILLVAVGIALLVISVALAVMATASKNIIGGADLPTFLFVFSCEKGGLYSILASLGIAAIIASIAVGLCKKK